VCLVLFLVWQRSHRPAFLTVRPDGPSFDTPISSFTVYFFTAFLGMSMVNVTTIVRNLGERAELWQLDAAILVFYLAAVAICFRAAWDHLGVRLRPDGVLHRGPLGSLFVPWASFDVEYPAWPVDNSDRLRLEYQGPARVRGIVERRSMTVINVDRGFLARTIQHYVAHPEDRAAIGTDAGYSRLMQALASPATHQA
jgi:hypothetical protein